MSSNSCPAHVCDWLGTDLRTSPIADQGGDALNFDFSTSGPLVLPVLSRTTPVRITLVGFGASSVKSSRKAVAEGVFTLNQVTRDPTDNVITVELDRYVPHPRFALSIWLTLRGRARRNGPPPLPCPYPLPQLQIDDEAPPDDTTTPPQNASRDGAASSNTEKLVLTLHARWRPGMSTTHADLVMATSSSARAAYELYLYKKDRGESTLAKQPRIASTSETTSDDYGGDTSLDWEDDDEEGEEGQVEEIENRKDGTRTRKGGTFRWIKHGAKVAKGRLQGIRQHQLSEMAPETELQSAL